MSVHYFTWMLLLVSLGAFWFLLQKDRTIFYSFLVFLLPAIFQFIMYYQASSGRLLYAVFGWINIVLFLLNIALLVYLILLGRAYKN